MANTRSYTRDEKYEAAAHYMVTGSQKKTANALGIPQKTLNQWVRREDATFMEAYQRAAEVNLKNYDAKVSSLIDKALRVLDSKLQEPENISAKDACLIHSMLYDKRQITRNMPTQITKKDTGDLARLADAFAEIAKGNTNKNIYDAELVDPTMIGKD